MKKKNYHIKNMNILLTIILLLFLFNIVLKGIVMDLKLLIKMLFKQKQENIYGLEGEQNIKHVLAHLKQSFPNILLDEFIIAGHSNGGDIAIFYASTYP